jgi:hypothetical protein
MKRACLPFLLLFLVACDSGPPAPGGFSVVDSAGVQIIVSESAAWNPQNRWHIGVPPRVQIGALDGDAEYLFDGRTVRAPPATWLRGGGQAVAWLDDGSFILGPANVPLRVPEGRMMLGGEWHLFDSSGDHVALLDRLPERWVESARGVTSPVPVLYGARALVTGTPEGVWYGFPGNFEIRRIGPGGVDRNSGSTLHSN